MFKHKPASTLAEDFKELGLIKESKTSNQPKQKVTELKKRQLREEAAKKEKTQKVLEAKKAKLRQLAEQKKAMERKHILESKKAAFAKAKLENKKKEDAGIKGTLENLMAIESKLNTNASLQDIMKAFENVAAVSKLALKKFAKYEQDQLGDDGKVNPADGNLGHDAEDEQKGDPAPSGKAGLDLNKGEKGEHPAPQKMAEMELPGDDDSEEYEDEKGMDYELEQEDELDLGLDMDLGDDEEELKLGDEELGDLDMMDEPEADMDMDMDMELEPEMEPEVDCPPEDDAMDEPVDDVDLAADPDLDVDMDMDADMGDDMGDEEMMGDEEEEEEDELGFESKKLSSVAMVQEIKSITKESEDVLNKIKKHALSPMEAESVLKDIVMRLGGAVGDLSQAEQYAASSKQTAVGESKKKRVEKSLSEVSIKQLLKDADKEAEKRIKEIIKDMRADDKSDAEIKKHLLKLAPPELVKKHI